MIELIDLTGISRSEGAVTQVFFDSYNMRDEWLRFGELELTRSNNHESGIWRMSCYLKDGATDFEHDSALALKMELIGIELVHVWGGRSIISGWVNTDNEDSFRVPDSAYNPAALSEAYMCNECNERHQIVPLYIPPPNPKLFAMVAGKRIRILSELKYKE